MVKSVFVLTAIFSVGFVIGAGSKSNKSCVLPNHPTNGKWEIKNGATSKANPGNRMALATVLIFSCDKNYELSDVSNIKCTEDGWNSPPPKCNRNEDKVRVKRQGKGGQGGGGVYIGPGFIVKGTIKGTGGNGGTGYNGGKGADGGWGVYFDDWSKRRRRQAVGIDTPDSSIRIDANRGGNGKGRVLIDLQNNDRNIRVEGGGRGGHKVVSIGPDGKVREIQGSVTSDDLGDDRIIIGGPIRNLDIKNIGRNQRDEKDDDDDANRSINSKSRHDNSNNEDNIDDIPKEDINQSREGNSNNTKKQGSTTKGKDGRDGVIVTDNNPVDGFIIGVGEDGESISSSGGTARGGRGGNGVVIRGNGRSFSGTLVGVGGRGGDAQVGVDKSAKRRQESDDFTSYFNKRDVTEENDAELGNRQKRSFWGNDEDDDDNDADYENTRTKSSKRRQHNDRNDYDVYGARGRDGVVIRSGQPVRGVVIGVGEDGESVRSSGGSARGGRGGNGVVIDGVGGRGSVRGRVAGVGGRGGDAYASSSSRSPGNSNKKQTNNDNGGWFGLFRSKRNALVRQKRQEINAFIEGKGGDGGNGFAGTDGDSAGGRGGDGVVVGTGLTFIRGNYRGTGGRGGDGRAGREGERGAAAGARGGDGLLLGTTDERTRRRRQTGDAYYPGDNYGSRGRDGVVITSGEPVRGIVIGVGEDGETVRGRGGVAHGGRGGNGVVIDGNGGSGTVVGVGGHGGSAYGPQENLDVYGQRKNPNINVQGQREQNTYGQRGQDRNIERGTQNSNRGYQNSDGGLQNPNGGFQNSNSNRGYGGDQNTGYYEQENGGQRGRDGVYIGGNGQNQPPIQREGQDFGGGVNRGGRGGDGVVIRGGGYGGFSGSAVGVGGDGGTVDGGSGLTSHRQRPVGYIFRRKRDLESMQNGTRDKRETTWRQEGNKIIFTHTTHTANRIAVESRIKYVNGKPEGVIVGVTRGFGGVPIFDGSLSEAGTGSGGGHGVVLGEGAQVHGVVIGVGGNGGGRKRRDLRVKRDRSGRGGATGGIRKKIDGGEKIIGGPQGGIVYKANGVVRRIGGNDGNGISEDTDNSFRGDEGNDDYGDYYDENIDSRFGGSTSGGCPSLSVPRTISMTCYDASNDIINCNSARDGASVKFKCPAFHEPQDFTYRTGTCKNGRWKVKVPTCVPVCGKKRTSGTPTIINGRNSVPGDYPWVAAVYRDNNGRYENICGGSILSTKVILTAAHCVTNDYGDPLATSLHKVGVGKYYSEYRDERDRMAQYSDLSNMLVSPKYRGQNQRFASDIAVLITRDPLVLSEVVQPICYQNLPQFQLHNDMEGLVTGWGYTAPGGSPSTVLKELTVPYKDEAACKTELPKQWLDDYLTYDKFCAGFHNRGTTVCKGDSGGGLVFEKGGRFYIQGIVSLGMNLNDLSCNVQASSLYTKVSAHYDWMRDIISDYR